METIQQTYKSISFLKEPEESLVGTFFNWCKSQEKNRLLWLALIITSHGCVLTPLTALIIVSTGNSIYFWGFAIAAMAMALVTNLAALPTRITIPIFLLSLVFDLLVILACISVAISGYIS